METKEEREWTRMSVNFWTKLTPEEIREMIVDKFPELSFDLSYLKGDKDGDQRPKRRGEKTNAGYN